MAQDLQRNRRYRNFGINLFLLIYTNHSLNKRIGISNNTLGSVFFREFCVVPLTARRSNERVNEMLDKIALVLLIIGGLNWGLVGIFGFDLVAWLFGGTGAILSRIVYVVVALSAIWCITLLFKNDRVTARS